MLKVLAVILAKVADGAEVWLLIRSEIPEGDVSFEKSVDFPGAADTLSVGEDEDFEQHDRMKLRSAPVFVSFLGIERLQAVVLVKVVDGIRNETFETVGFDPLGEILRKEVLLVLIVSDEVGCHGWKRTQ